MDGPRKQGATPLLFLASQHPTVPPPPCFSKWVPSAQMYWVSLMLAPIFMSRHTRPTTGTHTSRYKKSFRLVGIPQVENLARYQSSVRRQVPQAARQLDKVLVSV